MEPAIVVFMSENTKTRLFFIKSQPTDLNTIEGYLKKRNYEVMTESDLREAILKLIPFEPVFVFIAFDHPNEKVFTLPKMISQATEAIVVPYTLSAAKEQIRKLDEAVNFAHKLYPPISGPSIMRVISKIEKEAMDELQDPEKAKKSVLNNPDPNANFMVTGGKANPQLEQFLKGLESTEPAKPDAKAALQAEIIRRNQAKLKSIPLQHLDEKLKGLLQKKFEEDVKTQMLEMVQTSQEGIAKGASQAAGFRKLLCLIVQSASWCGYLLVGSQIEINNDDYKSLLQAWLQDQLVDLADISKYDYFEINLEAVNYADIKTWVQTKSDYLEFIEVDKNEIFVSFFTLEPKYLMLELNDNHQMLEVALDIIDVDRPMPFSLFIHLPENKKYLMYTLPLQSLLASQKQRLLDKSVSKLFTPIEFEAELKKLKAEKYLNSSYQRMKKDVS